MLHIFTKDELGEFISPREGELKLGQMVTTLSDEGDFFEDLASNTSKYVVIGIPEDIGVKMNGGNGGASTAFFPALKALLNTQSNQFLNAEDILVLGYLDFFEEVESFNDRSKGDALVRAIDEEVSSLIHLLVSNGKLPIIIGGGHNNSFGNLKGLSTGLDQKVNVINLDAHTDLRRLEERHSGNGFSYALNEGYLDKYFMFGLHENYTPQYIFDFIIQNPSIKYNTFEELAIYQSKSFDTEIIEALNFIKDTTYGIEIDLDCIQYFPSSAMTPTGFTPTEARKFVYQAAKANSVGYLHICEGAPAISKEPTAAVQVGKFISYLITDFIKSNSTKE